MTEVMAQDDTPHLIFSFYICLRLTSPNNAFMRRHLYSKRKVEEFFKTYFRNECVFWNVHGIIKKLFII